MGRAAGLAGNVCLVLFALNVGGAITLLGNRPTSLNGASRLVSRRNLALDNVEQVEGLVVHSLIRLPQKGAACMRQLMLLL